MSRIKKLFLWTTGTLGTLLIFLLILLLLLPYFINLEPVRQKIMADISQHIDGQFVFQQADFSFFPRPRIAIHQARVLIPEKVTVALEVLTIAPQIIPLLQGKVRISLVKAENPIITLELAGKSPEKEKSVPYGLTATRLIKAQQPEMKILIITTSADEEDLFEATKSGASGYLLKITRGQDFIEALHGLEQGTPPFSPGLAERLLREFARQPGGTREARSESREETEKHHEPPPKLTERQAEVLRLVSTGLTYKEVGRKLSLSEESPYATT